ncbi:hypothetical protein BC830DRAFT_350769 [Chytriomyces sp. MP71]|nr:hypothetical protein BC830DRAFT_350769 [Chytriomyces sp. MP71]
MGRSSKTDPLAQPTDAEQRRTIQVRLAQRKFRERKEARLKELEAQVIQLTAENEALRSGQPLGGTCTYVTCSARISLLETENARLRVECDILRDLARNSISLPSSSQPVATAAESAIPARPLATLTSAAAFGQPCEVDECRNALLQLSSLSDCRAVHTLCDLFMSMANCNDAQLVKCMVLKMMAARYQIFDTASESERPLAIRIIERCKSKNWSHVMHMYEQSAIQTTRKTGFTVMRNIFPVPFESAESVMVVTGPHTGSQSRATAFASPANGSQLIVHSGNAGHARLSISQTTRDEMLERSKSFRQSASTIPALVNCADLVDNLCVLFWTQSSCDDKKTREALFFDLVDAFNQLLTFCNNEENKTDFIMATEVGRQKERQIVNSMFDEVLSVNSLSGNLIEIL